LSHPGTFAAALWKSGLVFLLAVLMMRTTTAQDAVDRAAFLELRRAIEAERRINPEFPLENVLKRLRFDPLRAGVDLSTVRDSGTLQKPKGVTQDEWNAFLKLPNIPEEVNLLSLTLTDLDGDGKRDLIFVTGESSHKWILTSVLKRQGKRFTGIVPDNPDGNFETAFFSDYAPMNDSDWIRLRGRIYAVHGNRKIGMDEVELLRPFHSMKKPLVLRVHYRYRLVDKEGRYDKEQLLLLNKALGEIMKWEVKNGPPICPIPEDASPEEQAGYYRDPEYYSSAEIIYFPAWVDGECHIAELAATYGFYSEESGLSARFSVIDLNIDYDDDAYEIRRTAIRVVF
jgi:hypothetical protein